jgi:hypothetical protein
MKRSAIAERAVPADDALPPNYKWNGRAASAVPSATIVLARRSPKRYVSFAHTGRLRQN